MKSNLKKWKRLSSKMISDNPFARLDEDTVLLPDGQKKAYYLTNQNREAVSIIGVNRKGQILIQKEYRYPVDRVVYEFPGGLVDKGEKPSAAARREFREESGYVSKKWKKLGTYLASPSRTNLVMHVFLAQDVIFKGTSPDEAEFLEHEWISRAKLRKLAKSGTITSQTMIATSYLFFNQ